MEGEGNSTIFVSNISPEGTADSLTEFFSICGPLNAVLLRA